MKAFFNYIKARINTNVPAIKTVRMWNDQLNSNLKAKKEKPFPYPACFVEFIFDQVDNRCLGIVDYVMRVRFRFGKEGYTFERLDTFDFIDAFQATIQLMAPTQASGLTFTTFQEVAKGTFEDDFDNIETFILEYSTRYRQTSAFKTKQTIGGPLALETDIDIVEGIQGEGLVTQETDYAIELETGTGAIEKE